MRVYTTCAVLLVLLVSGCGGDGDAPDPSASSSAPGPTASSAPESDEPSAGDEDQAATCATGDLSVAVTPESGGGAAGTQYSDVTLTNTGGEPCAMTGWPGVSYVTGDDGEQVGAPADREGDPAVITLQPEGTATARLAETNAGDYGDVCRTTDVRGLRVYPPNQQDAVFVERPGEACAFTEIHQLTIDPVTG
ncbi:DUF4232 domain-containing protein [Aeromicrobium sp. YIM 150415]|uniref:DUF4232 domain-containing protein n=1 Tax=Aeromicrobium sp. YIM 150415 TaxID=2803912 RepID=UPI001966B069|nr:DUF4232 domain-containing protein [Aeromicrobium sp. YIM 150415]MBM9464662.1 DUF4232 domain-containing protein [Aeromicrobium sp. YIM 150415]